MKLYHGTKQDFQEIDLQKSHAKSPQYTTKNMSKETYMMESLTRELILRHMEEKHLPMRQAMEEIYNSKTYASLNNTATGLYFQSPVYLYDMFCEENSKQTPSDAHHTPA